MVNSAGFSKSIQPLCQDVCRENGDPAPDLALDVILQTLKGHVTSDVDQFPTEMSNTHYIFQGVAENTEQLCPFYNLIESLVAFFQLKDA